MTRQRSQRPGGQPKPGRTFMPGAKATWTAAPVWWRLRWLLNEPKAGSNVFGIAVAAALLVAATVVVCSLNELTGTTGHFGTVYLLGVLAVSATSNFWLSAGMSIASAVAFAYFRNWPEGHVAALDVQTWLLIGVFLLVGLLANTFASMARVGQRFFNLSSDLLCISSPKRVIRVNRAFAKTLGYTDAELASRSNLDLVDPLDRESLRDIFTHVRDSAEPARFENRMICSDGSRRWIEWSVVWHRGLFYAVGRDITERRHQQDELRHANAVIVASRDELESLAEQQSALRRVATLVARGSGPAEVFSAVAKEMAHCLGIDNAEVFRYENDDMAVVVGSYAEPDEPHIPVGERVTLEGDNVAASVLRTGRPARIDNYDSAAGTLAARLRTMGVRSRVGAPIVVDEHIWGLAVVGWSRPQPLPPDTEARTAEFADLVATAIAAATTRAELIASRARIVAAADQARRRLERDLHDGAQQRLVSLALQLRLAEDSTPAEMPEQKRQLADILSGLTAASDDLREISRGIHPASLSKGGLAPALKTLARRCTVPVNLDVSISQRFSDRVEVATYYVVAEALTNAAKHSQAVEVNVSAQHDDDRLYLSIRDDGVGGADSRKGSGLIGLADRVEALGGHIQVVSPIGRGTSLQITIPLSADSAPDRR